jgi:hypothetical protein
MTDPFDPFRYAADVKGRPENYCSLGQLMRLALALHAIRHAPSMDKLKERLEGAKKACVDAEDRALVKAAKDKRKGELA